MKLFFSWRTSSGANQRCFQPDKDQNKLVGRDQKLPKGAAIPIPEASKSTLDPLLISRGGREQQITLLVQEDYGSKVAASNFSLCARSRAGFVVLHPNTGRLQGVGGGAVAAAVICSPPWRSRELLEKNIKNACIATSEGKNKTFLLRLLQQSGLD